MNNRSILKIKFETNEQFSRFCCIKCTYKYLYSYKFVIHYMFVICHKIINLDNVYSINVLDVDCQTQGRL
jgi:hypothetical protein